MHPENGNAISKMFLEVNMMDCCNENKCIQCSVTQCRNHSSQGNYCALNTISVGTHEVNPTVPECTDCNSFEKK